MPNRTQLVLCPRDPAFIAETQSVFEHCPHGGNIVAIYQDFLGRGGTFRVFDLLVGYLVGRDLANLGVFEIPSRPYPTPEGRPTPWGCCYWMGPESDLPVSGSQSQSPL